jgi:hypothetical protein
MSNFCIQHFISLRAPLELACQRKHQARPGDAAIGRLLVFSQVLLSLQLPFALYPLIRLTNDHMLMGPCPGSM